MAITPIPRTESVTRVAALLREAPRVTILTGAGVSVDSGLGTYRTGDTALWTPALMARFANPRGFRANLADAWRWYDARRRAMRAARPNAGHRAIAELERHVPTVTVVTQNIDGLHQRAGSSEVIEIHGSLERAACFACGREREWPAEDMLAAEPSCPCGGLLRPGVVMFEEMLDETRLARATAAAIDTALFLAIGTSATVYPAAGLTEIAIAARVPVVLVNPDMTGQPGGPTVTPLAGPASELLPELVRLAWPGVARESVKGEG